MAGLLMKRFQAQLVLVLAGDVSSHRVVPGEGPRAKRTRNPDTLVTLPDMRSQIRLVAIQSVAEWTLQLFP